MKQRTHQLRYDDEPERRVRIWVDEPAGDRRPRSCVVILHGFKGFSHWGFFPELAHRLAADGHLAVRMNASGCGVGEDPLEMDDEEGFASNTVSREIEDLERVRRWVLEEQALGVDPERIGFLGHSMGGGVGLIHARLHGGWRSLVGWAAVSTFERATPEMLSEWRERGYGVFPNGRTGQEHRLDLGWVEDIEAAGESFSVPGACATLRIPTLLVHGDDDASVPIAEGRLLEQSLSTSHGRLEVVPGAGHTFGERHPPQAETPAALEQAFLSTLAHFRETLGG